jgi:radical SAM superfamily enzyme YgiQ (UPF0313 family)
MKSGILLVNPPIYDFAAYDFWLRPYGMLSVAGMLRGQADFALFDFIDRQHPSRRASDTKRSNRTIGKGTSRQVMAEQTQLKSDQWGRGMFYFEKIPNPDCLVDIPRYFRRFGLPRPMFKDFLKNEKPFDFAFIQTTMTYWYPGVKEVIDVLRDIHPEAKIVLGGNYVTLCRSHAETLGADLLISGTDLEPLWKFMNIIPDQSQPALWEVYPKIKTGALKLTDGCPFKCTYCSVPKVYSRFQPRSLEQAFAQLELLHRLGAENVAFYDDALLFDSEKVIVPFLEKVLSSGIEMNFHTPNALNARFITSDLANLMVRAGFRTFYLGFESVSSQWQKQTGSKVFSQELSDAVERLLAAGAQPQNITAYQILGHPHGDIQELEESMHFVHSLGIRGMLADFSPIPGTPDGDYCRKWVNLDEPLMHNKTAFPVILLGFDETNRLKDLQRKLNRNLDSKT